MIQPIRTSVARGKTLLGKVVQRLSHHRASNEQVREIRLDLLDESSLSVSYLILLIGSCVIATLGLLSNSAAVIIGAMIIAPLMLPIRGMAFGALEGNGLLVRRAVLSLATGTLLAVSLAAALGSLAGIAIFGSEVLARSKPTLMDLGIAIAAGGISGYAKVQPKISGSLAGTAIAVALMPPICAVGLGLSQGNNALSLGALLLYLTNLLGISLACMVAFWVKISVPFFHARRAVTWALGLTSLLLLPLSFSFVDLVQQVRLESTLRSALLKQTLTFKRVQLIDLETRWLMSPPEVKLRVRTQEKITPKQVKLLEDFTKKVMGRPFTLIFEINQVEEVRSVRSQPVP